MVLVTRGEEGRKWGRTRDATTMTATEEGREEEEMSRKARIAIVIINIPNDRAMTEREAGRPPGMIVDTGVESVSVAFFSPFSSIRPSVRQFSSMIMFGCDYSFLFRVIYAFCFTR